MSGKSGKNGSYAYIYKAPLRGEGWSPRSDAGWHAERRHGLKREVVQWDSRGLRVSDDIYQRSKTKVVRPSDRASVADRSGDALRGETKLSRRCGLDPPSVLDVHHIPPRYRDARSTLVQQLLPI